MKLSRTYRVRTKGFNHIFDETVHLYRQAVSFFMDVCLKEWKHISVIQGQKIRSSFMESLTVKTKQNPAVSYDFSTKFYKFPSYLRRAAIAEALGKVSSYRSNLANWEASGAGETRRETITACRWDMCTQPCTVPVCLSVPGCIRRR